MIIKRNQNTEDMDDIFTAEELNELLEEDLKKYYIKCRKDIDFLSNYYELVNKRKIKSFLIKNLDLVPDLLGNIMPVIRCIYKETKPLLEWRKEENIDMEYLLITIKVKVSSIEEYTEKGNRMRESWIHECSPKTEDKIFYREEFERVEA